MVMFYDVNSPRTKKQNGNSKETPMIVQIAIPIKVNQSLVSGLVENHKRKLNVSSFQFTYIVCSFFFSSPFPSRPHWPVANYFEENGQTSCEILKHYKFTIIPCQWDKLLEFSGYKFEYAIFQISRIMSQFHSIFNVCSVSLENAHLQRHILALQCNHYS